MTHPWFLSVMPYRKMEWSTVLKSFERSMNTPSVYLLFSKDSIILSTYCTRPWSVERPFWKPNTLEHKILFSVKYLYKRLYIMRSCILKSIGAQILIYSYLRHYYLTLINRSDWCYFEVVWKNILFNWEIKLIF